MIRSRTNRRSAFTLIELISVIAIIAVLAAIAISAYFRVRISQEEAATETTIAKVQSQLDQQWRSTLDNARDQMRADNAATIGWAKAMAGDDSVRALAILTKFRLKEDFPQTFWEAIVWPVQAYNFPVPSAAQPYGIAVQNNPPRYKGLILQGLPANTIPRDPSTMTADEQHLESAALLYMAITRTRRGNAGFNPNEQLGPHAVGRANIKVSDSPALFKDFDVFIDTWGEPISFIRWPFGGRTTDVNQSPHQILNKMGLPIDPQDPERRLFDPRWYTAQVPGSNPQVTYGYWFTESLRHPLDLQQDPLNLSPFVFSKGRDKLFGLAAASADNANGQNHFARISTDENDNIYSYRVKSGRGNN